MLNAAASGVLIVFVVIFAVIAVGLLAVVAIALRKLSDQVEKLTRMAEPAIEKATDTLDTVQRVTMTVGEKADHILSRGETLTDNVSDRVERTASIVQHTITTPLINLTSWIAGASKAFSVYGGAVSGKQNGHSRSTDNQRSEQDGEPR